jgi:myo-inositol-1(or 4)-monophosphatase
VARQCFGARAEEPVGDNLCCDERVETLDLDPTELRPVAERLATEAADFVRRRREELFGDTPLRESTGRVVRAKSTPTDPVTIVDTETERLLRDRLAELRPGEHVLGEEGGGSSDDSAGQPTWVVDPIDGTVNFVYGLPAYVVSVAVQVDGQSVAGAIANVVDGALYSAARGYGAHVRVGAVTAPLQCSAVDDLSMSLVGTGFSYDSHLRRHQAAVLAELLPQVRDIRRLGSAALDLCLVAAGRLDAYFEDNLNVWDWAAGALIAAEAGARVAVPSLGDPAAGRGMVVAAAPGVNDVLADALSRAGAL